MKNLGTNIEYKTCNTACRDDDTDDLASICKLASLTEAELSFSPDDSDHEPEQISVDSEPVKFISEPPSLTCSNEIAVPQPLRFRVASRDLDAHHREGHPSKNTCAEISARYADAPSQGREDITSPASAAIGSPAPNIGNPTALAQTKFAAKDVFPSSTNLYRPVNDSQSCSARPKLGKTRRSFAFNMRTEKEEGSLEMSFNRNDESLVNLQKMPALSIPALSTTSLRSNDESVTWKHAGAPDALTSKTSQREATRSTVNIQNTDAKQEVFNDAIFSPISPSLQNDKELRHPFFENHSFDASTFNNEKNYFAQKTTSVASSETSASSASGSERGTNFNPIRKLRERRKNRVALLDLDQLCQDDLQTAPVSNIDAADCPTLPSLSPSHRPSGSHDGDAARFLLSPRSFGLSAVFRRLSTSSSVDFRIPSMADESALSDEVAEITRFLRNSGTGDGQLINVLDAMYNLSTRLDDDILDSLYRHLASPTNVQACVRILVTDAMPASRKKTHHELPGLQDRRATNPYTYVIVNAIASGQSVLRKSVLSNARARGELLQFFEDDLRIPAASEEDIQIKVQGMARVLSSLLRESPTEMAEHLSGRKGFLHTLVRRYGHVSGVAEFVVELCAANPMASAENSDEIRYGSPNASGITLLVRERIVELLVDLFEKCTVNIVFGEFTVARRRKTEETCMFIMTELTKRALMIPKYEKANCSYGSRYIKELNACLKRLCAVDEPRHVAQALHYALTALFEMPGNRGGAVVTVLELIVQTLTTVQAGCRSKLTSTRMMLRRKSTLGLEQVALEHLSLLARIFNLEFKQGLSLHQLRLAVADLFACLFASTNSATLRILAEENIPSIMFSALRATPSSSLLHYRTVKCVEICFDPSREDNADAVQVLRKQWLSAMNNGNLIWQELGKINYGIRVKTQHGLTKAEARLHHILPTAPMPLPGYISAYIAIALVIRQYGMKADGKNDLRHLLGSEQEYRQFLEKRRQTLDRMAKLHGDYLCGPPPEKSTSSLLASPSSLAALSPDDIYAV